MSQIVRDAVLGAAEIKISSKKTSSFSCPVTCLGHLGGTFYFLDAVGQVRSLTARQLDTRAELIALFLDEGEWLRENFPCKRYVKTKDVNGNEIEELKTVDFAKNVSSAWLMAQCREAGLYGDHILIRRPGIWLGQDGRPVVHCGDRVFPTKMPPLAAGSRDGSQVWAAAPPESRPANQPASIELVKSLEEKIENYFNFKIPNAQIVIIGALGCAYYGAAIAWRPAIFLTGPAGSGKSSLLAIMRAACPLSYYTNDTTKAGLEQALDGRGMPSFVDEASDKEDQRGARALLDLVLSASGGEGTRGSRGGKEGKVRYIEVVGSIFMASIAPPDMKPQHFGRFTVLELLKAKTGADYNRIHKEMLAWAKKNGPGLWSRALHGWERLARATPVFRNALLKIGCSPRDTDQMAAIVCSYWVLTYDDEEPEAAIADTLVDLVGGFIRDESDLLVQDDAGQLIAFLLSQTVQYNRSTDKRSIAELIGCVIGEDQDSDDYSLETDDQKLAIRSAADTLARYGIRVIRADDVGKKRGGITAPRCSDGVGVWFWPSSAPLQKLFEGTQWSGQRFETALRRLETARRYQKQIRIGAIKCRGCVWVSGSELGFGDRASDG